MTFRSRRSCLNNEVTLVEINQLLAGMVTAIEKSAIPCGFGNCFRVGARSLKGNDHDDAERHCLDPGRAPRGVDSRGRSRGRVNAAKDLGFRFPQLGNSGWPLHQCASRSRSAHRTIEAWQGSDHRVQHRRVRLRGYGFRARWRNRDVVLRREVEARRPPLKGPVRRVAGAARLLRLLGSGFGFRVAGEPRDRRDAAPAGDAGGAGSAQSVGQERAQPRDPELHQRAFARIRVGRRRRKSIRSSRRRRCSRRTGLSTPRKMFG